MTHCESCGEETTFLSPQNDCLDCAQHDPMERAAITAFRTTPQRWVQVGEFARELSRENARRILTAAIDVDELAEHIGMEHARLVRDHLLGANDD